MFNVGDLIIYSTHGLCKIDEISEKTFGDVTKMYYIMHPVTDTNLTISIPEDSEQAVMLPILEKEDAESLLHSFEEPGIEWVEDIKKRTKKYKNLVDKGERKVIAQVLNTLMRKEIEAQIKNIRMSDQDRKLLTYLQNIMFEELAASLEMTYEDVSEKVTDIINQKV